MAANPWITQYMQRANRNVIPSDVYNKTMADLQTLEGMKYRYGISGSKNNQYNWSNMLATGQDAWRTAMNEGGYNPYGSTPVDQYMQRRANYIVPTMQVAQAYGPAGTAQGTKDAATSNREMMLNYLIGNTETGGQGYNPSYAETRSMLDALAADMNAVAQNKEIVNKLPENGADPNSALATNEARRNLADQLRNDPQRAYETFITAMSPTLGASTDYLLGQYDNYYNRYRDAMSVANPGSNATQTFADWFWKGWRNQ